MQNALCERRGEGDCPPFGDLYGPLLAYARQLEGRVADAEDLLHDTYERALRARPPSDDAAALRGWLVAVMRNLFIDRVRWRKRRGARLPIDSFDVAALETNLAPGWESIEPSDLERALAGLDEELQRAFRLRWERGCSYKQIAESLGIPPPTVGTRLLRARRKIRAALLRRANDTQSCVEMESAPVGALHP